MISIVKMDNVPPALAHEVNDFEQHFRYPVDHRHCFTVSHGADYARFYRSLGRCRLYLARENHKILGSMALIQRSITVRGHQTKALYIGDLKLAPDVGSKVLYLLSREAYNDHYQERHLPQYGIFLHGAPPLPSDYSCRMGQGKFHTMGKVAIMQIAVNSSATDKYTAEIDLHEARQLADELGNNEFVLPMSRASIRSRIKPRAFKLKDDSAVCIIEDTQAARKRYDESGSEINDGHISSFEYANALAGSRLLKGVLPHAADSAYAHLICAVPKEDYCTFNAEHLAEYCITAKVVARNLDSHMRCHINTAEI